MLKSRGTGSWDVILWLAIVALAIWAWVPDFLPADAGEVKSLAAVAAASNESREAFAAALKQTPNPTRAELRKMRTRVNELLVTETAREVTGDETLKAPADVQRDRSSAEAARQARLDAMAWREMSTEELALWVTSHWQHVLFALALGFGVMIAWRTLGAAQRGY